MEGDCVGVGGKNINESVQKLGGGGERLGFLRKSWRPKDVAQKTFVFLLHLNLRDAAKLTISICHRRHRMHMRS